MQMVFDDEIENTEFIFDSLNMVLYYDSYYFGDTTATQTVTVHQLEQEMNFGEDGYLYTTSQFAYNMAPLGSINLIPQPGTRKKVSIKLSDQLGRRLAAMIMNENDTVTSDLLFMKFFNGLTIRTNPTIKGAVVGFRMTDSGSEDEDSSVEIKTKPELRVYYHLSPNPDNLSELFYKFSFNAEGVFFNQIVENTSNSLIDGISNTNNERNSELTNQQVCLQSGVQIFAKFSIPYLDQLLLIGKNPAFICATLKLFPVKGTYAHSDQLPDSLYVYSSNTKNMLTQQIMLPGSTTDAVYARLNIIKNVEETVFYSIDIGNFIDTQLKEEFETNQSLMIGFKSDIAMKTASQLILGGQNSGKYSPELNIYYFHN